jgi:hypothetical protein
MRVAASAGITRAQLLDRRERQLQLAQYHDKACLVELGCVVVAIPLAWSTRAGTSTPSSS